jgi:hypothetical protein
MRTARALASVIVAGATLVFLITTLWPAELRAHGPDLSGPLSRWQGAWVVRDMPGSVQAWTVRGHDVFVYDVRGGTTDRLRFDVVSPCRVARTQVSPDGTRIETFDSFAFAPDGLHIAAAPVAAGVVRGSRAIACIDDSVYELDAQMHTCVRWNAAMTSPALPSHAECQLDRTTQPAIFTLRALQGGESTRLSQLGDALVSTPLMAHVAEPCATFEDAKARAIREGAE